MAVDDGNVIQLFGKKKQERKPDDISRTWVESFLIFMRDKYGLTFSRYLTTRC